MRIAATTLVVFAILASSMLMAETSVNVKGGMLGSTRNVHVCGRHILCGQPSAEDFAAAKQRGIKTVITLRLPDEINWNEAKAVQDLGLNYHDLGFRSPDSMTDELIKKAVSILGEMEQGPVLLHCASANRVGAIWMAHRVINDGLSVDAAAAEGKEVGLRTAAYEAKVRQYLKNRQPKQKK